MMDKLQRQALWTVAGVAGAYSLGRFVTAQTRKLDFRRRVVLITGGSRGLGIVLARKLADEGAHVAICARSADELARAQQELASRGARVVAGVCDVTQPDQVPRFHNRVNDELGPVDVLINNAGMIQVGPLECQTPEDFAEALAVHFWGPFHMTQSVLPEMKRRRAGRIVNIVSVGGQIAVPHLAPYCASKFALAGYSQALRSELLKHGIYVTTIFPGLMRTGSSRNAWFKGRHRDEYAWFSISASMPWLSMSAERAARQIIDACRYGRSKCTLSLPAKLAVYANVLAPELLAEISALVAGRLPSPGGIGQHKATGSLSASAWSPSMLTTLGDRAAARNNQMSTPPSIERA